MSIDEKWGQARIDYYEHMHSSPGGVNEMKWRGKRIIKYPSDLILYTDAIQENKPDWIVETGTHRGGSSTFFRDMFRLFGGKGVITIDIKDKAPREEGVTFFEGSSIDPGIIQKVKDIVGKDSVMVVLDSDHRSRHVYRELQQYSNIVTKGQFIVVEDCYTRREQPYGPHKAVRWFLGRDKRFVLEPRENKYVFAVTRGGWLRRV